MRPPGTRLLALATLFLAATVAGCGLFSASVAVRSISFNVSAEANGNAPIPVDLVLTSAKDITTTVMGLTAAEWFSRKAQLMRDAPDTLRVESFELVPGSIIEPRRVTRDPTPTDAMLFANYQTPGDHRERLTKQEDVSVMLGPRDMSVQP